MVVKLQTRQEIKIIRKQNSEHINFVTFLSPFGSERRIPSENVNARIYETVLVVVFV
jgi:hypothetical protein